MNDYPVRFDVEVEEEMARWRPFVHWFLAIPHFIVLYALNIIGQVVVFIGIFAVLFTGGWPSGLLGLLVMVQRYQFRVTSYVLFLRSDYPPFQFPQTLEDPGDDPARYEIDEPQLANRAVGLYQWFLVIPNLFVVGIVSIAMAVVAFVGAFAVLITGRWPSGWAPFVVGTLRWTARAYGYAFFVTSRYPPFSTR